MSNNQSGSTRPLALRLPVEVHTTLLRRARKQGLLVSEYVRNRLVYDTLRMHVGKR